jgi:hypothetical protein
MRLFPDVFLMNKVLFYELTLSLTLPHRGGGYEEGVEFSQ